MPRGRRTTTGPTCPPATSRAGWTRSAKKDPSLAVAHGCFWKYHPEVAYRWELRLQDEIGPDFTIDEQGSDDYRAAFEDSHPDVVEQLRADEEKRRARKRKKERDASGSAGPLFDQDQGGER